MNIIIRVDSSNIIGTGHIMRCISLGLRLQMSGNNVKFISKNLKYNIIDKISKHFDVFIIPKGYYDMTLDPETWFGESVESDCLKCINVIKPLNIDVLIIDQYAIDYRWEFMMSKYVKKIFVFDDTHTNKHFCDILLSYACVDLTIYENLVPNHCKIFQGIKYLPIHSKYLEYGKMEKKFNNPIKKIVVTLGGSDPLNDTKTVLQILDKICKKKLTELEIDVIIGGSNKYYDDICYYCKDKPSFNIHQNVNNMEIIYNDADFCIGAVGTSAIERALLGIPTFLILLANNQKDLFDTFIKNELAYSYIYKIDETIESIKKNAFDMLSIVFNDLYTNNHKLRKISDRCKSFVSCDGIKEICDEIMR